MGGELLKGSGRTFLFLPHHLLWSFRPNEGGNKSPPLPSPHSGGRKRVATTEVKGWERRRKKEEEEGP